MFLHRATSYDVTLSFSYRSFSSIVQIITLFGQPLLSFPLIVKNTMPCSRIVRNLYNDDINHSVIVSCLSTVGPIYTSIVALCFLL